MKVVYRSIYKEITEARDRALINGRSIEKVVLSKGEWFELTKELKTLCMAGPDVTMSAAFPTGFQGEVDGVPVEVSAQNSKTAKKTLFDALKENISYETSRDALDRVEISLEFAEELLSEGVLHHKPRVGDDYRILGSRVCVRNNVAGVMVILRSLNV